MLCYKLQSLGRKCPNSVLKLKFPLSSVFDKLIAGLLISLCSFQVLPDDCSVDGFFAKRHPCLTAVSLHLLLSTSLQYAQSDPSALLLNLNLSFICLLGIQDERNCRGLGFEMFFCHLTHTYKCSLIFFIVVEVERYTPAFVLEMVHMVKSAIFIFDQTVRTCYSSCSCLCILLCI